MAVLDTEKRTLEKKRKYDFQVVKCSKTIFQFLTGLSEPDVFLWILSLIKDNVTLVKKNFSYEKYLLLVIMNIRLGCSNKDLAYRFELKTELVSKIYRQWIKALSQELRKLIIWPSKGALRKHLPSCFKSYKTCVCIIDCTEIFIERPLKSQS